MKHDLIAPDLFRTKHWTWHIPSQEAASELKDAVLSPDCLVKATAVRAVYRYGAYFLKLEHPADFSGRIRGWFRPKARTEYRIGRALEAAGIPAVRCEGWGKCGSSNVLITRAMPDTVSLDVYCFRHDLCGGQDPEEILTLLTDFLTKFFDAGFHHGDLHFGNILFNPKTKQLAWVDLIEIEHRTVPTRLERRTMCRALMALRSTVTRNRLLDMLCAVGAAESEHEAEAFYFETVSGEAAHLHKTWPKRRTQILSGYPKFTAPVPSASHDGPSVLLRRDRLGKELISPDELRTGALPPGTTRIQCDSPEAAETLFLRSFYCQFMQVRHRRVLVFERPDILWLEPLPSDLTPVNPDDRETSFFLKTLCAEEIQVAPDDVSRRKDGSFYLRSLAAIRAGFEI